MERIVFILIFVFSIFNTYAQESINKYVNKYSSYSLQEMRKFGIPASIKLAQGILESNMGNSHLSKKSKNHFGIKCHGWKYSKVYHDDDVENECFRKYRNVKSSYRDHSLFLVNNKRYSRLFELDLHDYKSWAENLKECGYATDPMYSQKIIDIIENHKLYEYDNLHISRSKRKFIFMNTYGFPFLHGFGLSYFNQDKYFISTSINSSLIYGSLDFGFSRFLKNNFYCGLTYSNVYYPNLNEDYNFYHSLVPQFTIERNLLKQRVLINIGAILINKEIKNVRVFPKISLSILRE